MNETIRMNFNFPRSEYPYIKLICAQKGISFREYASNLIFRDIEDYKKEKLLAKAEERLDKLERSDLITWKEATKLAGWKLD